MDAVTRTTTLDKVIRDGVMIGSKPPRKLSTAEEELREELPSPLTFFRGSQVSVDDSVRGK